MATRVNEGHVRHSESRQLSKVTSQLDARSSLDEALAARVVFPEKYLTFTNPDNTALQLSELQRFDDGRTYAPALWEDWKHCVEALVSGRSD